MGEGPLASASLNLLSWLVRFLRDRSFTTQSSGSLMLSREVLAPAFKFTGLLNIPVFRGVLLLLTGVPFL